MESSLSVDEAVRVSDAFLITLYTSEVYHRWRALKKQMNFTSEKDFVIWLLDFVTAHQHVYPKQKQDHGVRKEGFMALASSYTLERERSSSGVENILLAGSSKNPSDPHRSHQGSAPFPQLPKSKDTASSFGIIHQNTPWLGLDHNSEVLLDSNNDNIGKLVSQRSGKSRSRHRREVVKTGHVKCEQCSKLFMSHRNMLRHINDVHYGLKDHQCCYCHKMFAQPNTLKRHLHTCHHHSLINSDEPSDCTQPSACNIHLTDTDTKQTSDSHFLMK